MCEHMLFTLSPGNWLKRSSLSGLTDGVEDLLDISSVDRLSFIRQSSKVRRVDPASFLLPCMLLNLLNLSFTAVSSKFPSGGSIKSFFYFFLSDVVFGHP